MKRPFQNRILKVLPAVLSGDIASTRSVSTAALAWEKGIHKVGRECLAYFQCYLTQGRVGEDTSVTFSCALLLSCWSWIITINGGESYPYRWQCNYFHMCARYAPFLQLCRRIPKLKTYRCTFRCPLPRVLHTPCISKYINMNVYIMLHLPVPIRTSLMRPSKKFQIAGDFPLPPSAHSNTRAVCV